MFTGLIESLGKVSKISPLGEGKDVWITASFSEHLEMGESISINGICSTVVSFDEQCFQVQFLKETLDKTTVNNWYEGDAVNLERAMRPTTRFGGHMVSGHVDGKAKITRIDDKLPWHVFEFSFDEALMPYFIEKGSVCIDGISLTLVDVKARSFTCHIIPHTYQNTVLHGKKIGDAVNIECDVMAKYFFKFFQLEREGYHVGV